MARVTLREIIKLRSSVYSHPPLIPSKSSFFTSSPVYSYFSAYHYQGSTVSLYNPIFHLLRKCRNMRQLSQIQASLVTSGLVQNPFIASRVLALSADLNSIHYTLTIFQHVDSPDTFCINIVIKAYSKSCVPQQAVVFYFEMLKNGFMPNSFTFPPLVSSCAESGCYNLGEKTHGQAIKNGVDNALQVQNSLIHMYGCCGLIDAAKKMFDQMPHKDLVSWNSIITGYVRCEDLGIAHMLFDEMAQKNVVTWNVLISGYLKGKNPGCGLKLFREMMNKGYGGSHTTMASVITACGRSLRLKEGKSVHGSVIRTFMDTNIILDTALIDMYSKCQRVELAEVVFDRILDRNLVCWNAIVLGHCIHGNPQNGLHLFVKMVNEERGFSPDKITFIGVLCACAREGMLSEGKKYFTQMVNVYDLKPNFAHFWCMANLYNSVGLIQEAVEILSNISDDENDDLSSESSVWAHLLGLCRFKGDVNLGEQVAKSVLEVDPENFFCYGFLMNIYAIAGKWEEVNKVEEMMKEKGVKRLPGCNLVDLNDIVHNLKVGDKWQNGRKELSTMIDEVPQRFLSSLTMD